MFWGGLGRFGVVWGLSMDRGESGSSRPQTISSHSRFAPKTFSPWSSPLPPPPVVVSPPLVVSPLVVSLKTAYKQIYNVYICRTLVHPKLEYAAPIWHPYHETQIGQVEKVQRTAARWTCRRWRNNSSVGDMLDDLEWPSLETRREQSSLTFFYKIHSGTVSVDKDKYLTPAPNLRRTRASHESQYTRYFAYSDALKNSFFPRTIPMWNNVPSSVVSSKTIEEFKTQI